VYSVVSGENGVILLDDDVWIASNFAVLMDEVGNTSRFAQVEVVLATIAKQSNEIIIIG